ncbi:thioredoxin domain-containing protein [Desulfobacterales bacterium HSG17]|nr:thioredoxin domain-containing protein [Desulfobacterales bacterium HSG17]
MLITLPGSIAAGQALTGIKGADMELNSKFQAARKEKGTSYKPRTKHLDKDGWAQYTNRLFLESSPYLLQHAHNPVNWYPWGDEAFETARKKGLPILLSVGYSTCHWCHVMEEESFEDIEIATYINENYIAIKVDREERPDVDAIYMSAVQAITGRGGWPMTVWLTPDRKPFYGGTYFPPRDGEWGVSMGFLTILNKVKEYYDQNPEQVQQAGVDITNAIQKSLSPAKSGKVPSQKVFKNSIQHYKNSYDSINGGLTGAPKFPGTMPISLLFRFYHKTGDKAALEIAEQTLIKMAQGGIYDQVGGGFHRYSTDEKWLVPHFEKMLYDNALLTVAYLDGFQITGNTLFKQVVDETLLYIQRDMTAPNDGFFSATDADSKTPEGENHEGYYFTWTPTELKAVLGKKDASVVAHYFGVTESGNFEGRNILNITKSAKIAAKKLAMPQHSFDNIIAVSKSKLYKQRNTRPELLRDEKILTAWNGLMISAFAQAGLLLKNQGYINSAKNAAGFIIENLYKKNELFRSYKDGRARHKAYLDDYAFFIAALLDLFEADPDPLWFKTALKLDKTLSDLYEDKNEGGFFMTANNHEDLIAREKPGIDGALPSGNAIAAMNLFRLAVFTGNKEYKKRGDKTLAAFSSLFESNPSIVSNMITAFDFSLASHKKIVIVAPENNTGENELFLKEFRNMYIPDRILIQVEQGEHAEQLSRLIPLIKEKTAINNNNTAYVCEKGICYLPSFTAKNFLKQF